MRIDPMQLPGGSRLVRDYRNNVQEVVDKFDYAPFDERAFGARKEELLKRQFPRKDVAPVLLKANEKWGAGAETFRNIELLEQKETLAVVGGQQAGLLTGPLFSIHKIVSIITLAKEQSSRLGVPVVPVFWIAGEDHDFDEINHAFIRSNTEMKKVKIKQQVTQKSAASDLILDKKDAQQFAEQILKTQHETVHTRKMREDLFHALELSDTYVDFFARLIHCLFPDSGLILADSGDQHLRKVESPYFEQLIKHQEAISKGVSRTSIELQQYGYPDVLGAESHDAHLFCYVNGERTLLERDAEGNWRGKNDECIYSTEELKLIAAEQPERLSNNVVTRPLMQDMLFPVLAFIGGPGEVAYWANLKPAFHALGFQMPLVLPRLSFTLIDQQTEKLLNRYQLQVDKAIQKGIAAEKMHYLAAQQNPPIAELTEQVKTALTEVHAPLRDSAKGISDDLGELAESNLSHLLNNIDFLAKRMNHTIRQRHQLPLDHFDLIQTMLHPANGLQERTWNIIPFWNKFGKEFVRQMTEETYSFSEQHYIVYLS